jgi:hypothetical protein
MVTTTQMRAPRLRMSRSSTTRVSWHRVWKVSKRALEDSKSVLLKFGANKDLSEELFKLYVELVGASGCMNGPGTVCEPRTEGWYARRLKADFSVCQSWKFVTSFRSPHSVTADLPKVPTAISQMRSCAPQAGIDRQGNCRGATKSSRFVGMLLTRGPKPLERLGGRTRARTWDPLIKSQLLYQLSYAPGCLASGKLSREGVV